MIPKIIVFVDSLDERITLAYHLCNLFPAYMKKDIKRLIQILNLILESDTKAQYLEDFCNDDIKIWICTDIAGMGVAIENILQIVQ